MPGFKDFASRPADTQVIPAGIFVQIIDDLNAHPELQRIFGQPVSDHLYAVADGNDLRLEAAWTDQITQAQADRFLEILGEVIADHSA